MIRWLKKMWGRFRYVVHINGDPYLVRYRLLVTPWFCIYLHHILRSDNDRVLHDHPFNFTTVILWGMYDEILLGSSSFGPLEIAYRRRMFSVIRHKSTDFHRLILPHGKVWSLFIRGPKHREWGFLMDDGTWLPWQDFVRREENTDNSVH